MLNSMYIPSQVVLHETIGLYPMYYIHQNQTQHQLEMAVGDVVIVMLKGHHSDVGMSSSCLIDDGDDLDRNMH